ncbi:MAG TPA: cache domain-containing protein [Candidatus Nitrosopolaris sp.]|nr:cache domain-containing protein [Candidatus Nitrosopolaris sp.]
MTRMHMNLFSGKERELSIFSIILIIISSNGLLFYFQNITEHDLRDNLFEQQKEHQIESTKEVSQHIGSDLSLVMSMLDGLANSNYLQQGQLSSDRTKNLLGQKYIQHSNVIDRLFLLNNDNVVTASLSRSASDTIVGTDLSFQDWVVETRRTLQPVFSDSFESLNLYRIFITTPVINLDTKKYIGTLVTSILTEKFFSRYGNINDINSEFLVAYDENGTILANGANRTLVGQNFFGNPTQKFINRNEILNNLTHNLFEGNPGAAVYDYGKGERLTTAYPIFVNGKPKFFIEVVTPTSQIYSVVNNVLSIQRTNMFSFFAAASTVAIVILIILLRKWNIILRKEVKRRTMELEESYDEMKSYLQEVLKELKSKKL